MNRPGFAGDYFLRGWSNEQTQTLSPGSQLVLEHQETYHMGCITSIADKICTAETLRKWVRRAETNLPQYRALYVSWNARILKRANEIFNGFFSTADRRAGAIHRPTPGCTWGRADMQALPIAPSTYYEHKARASDPARVPARVKRDQALSQAVYACGMRITRCTAPGNMASASTRTYTLYSDETA